jgi:ethanolamine kinase
VPIKYNDFEFLNIDRLIGHKLAVIHKLTLPITKNPDYINIILGYIKREYQSLLKTSLDDITFSNSEHKRMAQAVYTFDLLKEIEWTFKGYPQIESPIVFSHNDLKMSNILLKSDYESTLDKIVFIDFENSSYNFRAYDLAFYVNFKYFDISKGPLSFDHYQYPTLQEQAAFRQYYLEEWMKDNVKFNPKVDNDDHLEMEMSFFLLMHDLQMIGWKLIRIKTHASVAFAVIYLSIFVLLISQ